MKKVSLILATVALIFASSCKDNANKNENDMDNRTEMNSEDADMNENNDMDNMDDEQKVVVDLKGMHGSDVSGQVTFTEENGEVTLKGTVNGLAEGTHAIHIHENADCSTMAAAGGHWNPTDERHGKWGAEEGYHKGDIGNFKVNSDGVGEISFSTDEWCIGCGDKNKDILNHSVIVHEGVDDFTSQPSGGAGGRMACGTITK
ncbi:MAG TPA: superoxide dismutase family protein [Flavobacteriaceae bacterium]|nr:superoxide dismutase family protein [Flavobacteriaceae bacterium]